jgi:hypothetical protein
VGWLKDLRTFAAWAHEHDLAVLAGHTSADLDDYRDHVLSLPQSAGRKAGLLTAVRRLWAYRAHLPAPARISADPFGGASGQAITGGPRYTLANKTPRIAASTMDALLAWSLRTVEDFGPDITTAWSTTGNYGKAPTHPRGNWPA